jgi:hypothetical protein
MWSEYILIQQLADSVKTKLCDLKMLRENVLP